MIYTHVTTSSIEKVISPLDRLRQLSDNKPKNEGGNYEKPER